MWRSYHQSLVFILLLLIIVLLRYPALFPSVFDWDESLYLVMAQHWLRGDLPYDKVWDQHSIGLPALFAGIEAVVGPSVVAARLSACVAIAVTATMVFTLTRRMSAHRAAPITATALYTCWMSLRWSYPANTELYLNALVSVAFYLVSEKRTLAASAAAMLLLGMALQVKHVVVVETALLLALTIAAHARTRLVGATLCSIAALALPTAIVLAYFWWVGLLGDYIAAVVWANLRYAADTPSWSELADRLRLTALLPVGTAVLGMAVLQRSRRTLLVALWCVAALADVVLPRQFWHHYFILLAPSAAILGGQIAEYAAVHWSRRRAAAAVAVVILVFGSPFKIIRDAAFAAERYEHDTPRLIADRLQVGEDDYLFVYNYEPIIYYFTNARLPTRYVLPAEWWQQYVGISGIDPAAELTHVFTLRPKYVIVSSDDAHMSRSVRRELAKHLDEYHVAFAVADLPNPPVTVTVYIRN